MRLPNLLGSRRGRIAAFFFMYLTEGIPMGFATSLLATQLRRLDVGTAEIGALISLTLLPWAFKWAYGPIVDVFRSRRFGARRGWILLAQVMMVATLALLPLLDLPRQLGVFTAVLMLHNLFAAVQDVAVDALACNTLHEDERSFASGMMFGGQSLGMLLGGGGALMLSTQLGFGVSIAALGLTITSVLLLVVLPMRETTPALPQRPGSRWAAAWSELAGFVQAAGRAMLGSRRAFGGLLFGLLPIAAMGLSLALQTNLAVDLGFSNQEIAWLGGMSSATTALTCVIGGWLSDRLDRRRALAVYVLLLSLPGLYLMAELQRHGWVSPRDGGPARAPQTLILAFWIAAVAYHLLFGFIYGARAALFIDITTPAVAATQFAAYMALTNLSISYSALWQGWAIAHWGYPATLGLDALLGLSCLVFLPLLKKP